MLAPGNTFTYYGEEIGIESDGSKDEYKRTAMIWDSEKPPDPSSHRRRIQPRTPRLGRREAATGA